MLDHPHCSDRRFPYPFRRVRLPGTIQSFAHLRAHTELPVNHLVQLNSSMELVSFHVPFYLITAHKARTTVCAH
jgi:hypothetical protein